MEAEKELELSKITYENPGISLRKLAALTGLTKSSVGRWQNRVKRLAQKGYAPDYDMTHVVPDGYSVKGVSTNYDSKGVIRQQWVKTSIDREVTLEALKIAVEGIIEPCQGVVEYIEAPKRLDKDLMTVYPIPDLHLGMFSWKEETGANYDTKKAVELLNKAQGRLIAKSPHSETCLIANLGDFFHADTTENKTMRSGNVLDTDSRWGKVLWAGVQAYRDVIKMALTKHKKVIVKSAIGNHDDHSNVALAMAVKLAFEKNKRVNVEIPINPFQYHTFGKVLLGMVHDCKPSDLQGIMANDMRKEWGYATFCHWLTGHLHTQRLFEYQGCTVETFRTIAAKDAWTQRKGYRSGRDMQSIVYHKRFGEVERSRVGIESL